MEELIKQVTERAGISEDQARAAVETVLGHLQKTLPAGLSQQLGGLLGGAGASGGVGQIADRAGDLVGGLGGILGGRKE